VHVVPGFIVDRLPPRLWHLGNLYGNRFTGYRLHFCYGDGDRRTVEWRGQEVGRGRVMRAVERDSHTA
jgi:hypothetical protein